MKAIKKSRRRFKSGLGKEERQKANRAIGGTDLGSFAFLFFPRLSSTKLATDRKSLGHLEGEQKMGFFLFPLFFCCCCALF